jgi:putative membrane protein
MNLRNRILSNQLRIHVLALAGATVLCTAPAMAQQNPGAQNPGAPSMQHTPGAPNSGAPMVSDTDGAGAGMDKMFVRKALQGGMAEVQLGQMALQKSSNDDVKQFAQRMVDDHTKMGDQMKQVAQDLNVKVPDSPSSKDKAIMAKLQALNGDAFDKAYIRDMVKDHEEDQKEFRQASMNASNPEVKQAATQGEQVITEHLQMIQQIAQKNNVASK